MTLPPQLPSGKGGRSGRRTEAVLIVAVRRGLLLVLYVRAIVDRDEACENRRLARRTLLMDIIVIAFKKVVARVEK
jgi:hypothetical protein